MQMGFSKVHPACHSKIKDHYLSTSLNGFNDKLIIYIVFSSYGVRPFTFSVSISQCAISYGCSVKVST